MIAHVGAARRNRSRLTQTAGSGKFLAQGFVAISREFFSYFQAKPATFPVTSLFLSPLYRHDPLFRIIRVPRFHKASFCPDVNVSECATWD